MGKDGMVLRNTGINNRDSKTRKVFAKIPGDTGCVTESSSARYGRGCRLIHQNS